MEWIANMLKVIVFHCAFPRLKCWNETVKFFNKKHKFEVMENFIKFLEIYGKQEEKSCDQFQHVQKPEVCNEELNHKEEDEGYKWKVSSCSSNSECSLEGISTQNGPFNFNSNSMSSCVSQWNCFKFEIPYRS